MPSPILAAPPRSLLASGDARVDAAAREVEENRARSLGVDLARLREPAVLSYDTAHHPFHEHITACLGLDCDAPAAQQTLETLHAIAEDEVGTRRNRGGDRGPSTVWIQRWLRVVAPRRRAHDAFNAAYLEFLRAVVVPHIGDPRGILFQRRPTFRCHVAHSGEATGVPHRDADYGHHR